MNSLATAVPAGCNMDISLALINGLSAGIEHISFEEYLDGDMPQWMIVINLLVFRVIFSKY